MKSELQTLIDNEDKKNPYTDESLAEKLLLSRSEVTLMRQELGIPDSRERRKPFLLKEIQNILASNPAASEREVTQLVNRAGFSVSRFTVGQLLKEWKNQPDRPAVLAAEPAPQPVGTVAPSPKEVVNSAFANLIGAKGSLYPVIEQAKAAVLYPPRGLHTLIVGGTGVGKSELAEAMYRFAVETGKLAPQAPFVVFNCADYADNPQLLLSQLFGHAKGAFTGAERPKEGLVEKADGGILFLDEVHRLPPEGQEILFYLIDKGKFRRLGETETLRRVSVMLIAATTEDPVSALLTTFRRRIPMVIEVPNLQNRPLSERLSLIRYFLEREARRTGSPLTIESEALRAMLLYDCPGNVGQLSSDIQVACARGFLNLMATGEKSIRIGLAELPNHARRGLLKIQHRRGEIEKLRIAEWSIVPGEGTETFTERDDLYSLPGEIYAHIEKQYKRLSEQGIPQDEINRLIGMELEAKFLKWVKQVDAAPEPLAKTDLYKVVGKPIVDTVENMLREAGKTLGLLDERLLFGLSIHLAAALDRLKQNKPIFNPHLNKAKTEYAREFAVAQNMAASFAKSMGVELPEEEVGFIALYLRTMYRPPEEQGRVGILVLSHGRVAAGMAEVANRLLGVSHAKAVEMSLDESPEVTLERTREMVTKIDEGKGVLLLVDMGSLATFGEIITKETGIPTRTVGPVYTVMVIEAVRRALLPDTTLDELANTLGQEHAMSGFSAGGLLDAAPSSTEKPVVLTVCITGEGAAIRLQKTVERLLGSAKDQVEVIPLGLADHQKLSEQVREVGRTRSIKAVVGTLNPYLPGVPFVSAEELLRGDGSSLLKHVVPREGTLAEAVQEELIVFPSADLAKPQILDLLTERLVEQNLVEPGFAADVLKRELLGVPMLTSSIAIPHGDPQFVKKSSLAIAVLPGSVPWGEGHQARIVCLLALSTDGKAVVQELFKRLSDEKRVEKILHAKTPREVREVLLGD